MSGRSIASLDALFAPFRAVAVGLHGMEVRRAPDAVVERPGVGPAPGAMAAAVRTIAARHGAGLVEDKSLAIAVHHRLPAPAMQALRGALLGACAEHAPDWTVLRGRRVLELKPAHANKGRGVDALMLGPPFRDSWPVAFGDDVTDLDMFDAVRRHGGTAIAVGPRIAGSGDLGVDGPETSLALLRAIRAAMDAGGGARRILDLLRRGADG